MEYPQRKRNRLAGYDYSAPGAYFVTICTHEKSCILGAIAVGEGLAPPIVGLAPPIVELTPIGRIVESQILALPNRYPALSIDKYVIMPNHVHLLLSLAVKDAAGGASPSPTVSDAVCALKSLSSRQAKSLLSGAPLWQRSFHDHIVRNDQDFQMIWKYIDENPAKWADDRFYLP